ncbi:PspA/IM30 family protein [Salipiger sp. P9]|uniref:PspA/IM30 family protein n=1 Tax=Salipiger pentaromativorans TaxID=2943193 RepID=UPI002157DEF5|nr:PspA/IM30 family protein [Salipiger pentaromativorans]MCR8547833.1 PspA/IM30 family protein [Salipiger pentaromativorans]
MFKTLITLVRGQSHDAAQALTDANAMSILRQQLRDAAHGVEAAKRSVAVVMAYCDREKKALRRISAQLSDLEARALDALRKDREDLATEAAAAIAELEAERATTERAVATYDTEIRRLREELSLAEQRLRTLQRGKQLADATAKSQRVRGTMPDGVLNSLREAEATLERLQERQGLSEATALAMADLSASSSAEATSARLAAAGCGAPLRPDAAAVLARLKTPQT